MSIHKIISANLITLILCSNFLFGDNKYEDEDKLVSSLKNVDLIAVKQFDSENVNTGIEYYVFNNNEYSVEIQIVLEMGSNTLDELNKGKKTVKGLDRISVGNISRKNPINKAEWILTWEINKK